MHICSIGKIVSGTTQFQQIFSICGKTDVLVMFDPIDLTARKGQLVLLRDNISVSSRNTSKCIYILSESLFLALNYRLHSSSEYSAFVV